MAGFVRDDRTLVCDGVPLEAIARSAGTPLHVYSASIVAERWADLARAFRGLPHRVHYALKANSTLAVLRLLRGLGARADANSGGEITAALAAGFTPRDIVFTGVGKTPAELARAVALDLEAINAESPGEVARLEALAAAQGRTPRIALRINPDVDAGSHPHISTGHGAAKFGMSLETARAVAGRLGPESRVRLVALHVHIGSQIVRPEPVRRAAEIVAGLARELRARGCPLEYLDAGGGLGIPYRPDEPVMDVDAYARTIAAAAAPAGCRILLEPGRWLVGPAGVLLTTVVDLKQQADRRFVVVDAGMTDLLRPALYGAWHGIEAVTRRPGAATVSDVVGPVCETADTLGRDRELPPVRVGDLLAIRDTGAYASVMASNYNRRPAAAEVLVDDGAWRIVRRRQTPEELLEWEQ